MLNLTIPTSELARRIRVHCVKMTGRANASHIGSALSTADILAVLYGKFLRFDPKQPDWPERDRFILSKGHACTGLYAVLAETGFLSVRISRRSIRTALRLPATPRTRVYPAWRSPADRLVTACRCPRGWPLRPNETVPIAGSTAC